MVEYTARLTWEWLLLHEMQITARLMLEWKTKKEAQEQIINENLYQYERLTAITRRFPFIWRRLSFLWQLWLDLFLEDIEQARILWIYSIYKDNNLFDVIFEQVVWKKIQNWSYTLYKSDIDYLFQDLETTNSEVKQRTDKTRYKIYQVFLKILSDANMLNNDRLQKPYIPIKIKNYLEQQEWGRKFLLLINA